MQRSIEQLQARFDVLVLGGGITGAGVALDAALRGLRVALIDKGDFGGGTSSVSSKLVHGGLRYLEQAQFRLVYEALHERGRLLASAPHLVHPLPFVIPFYTGAAVPGWKWRLGLCLYDALAGACNIRRSSRLSSHGVVQQAPILRSQGLSGGAKYFDAQMDDARLCLAVIKTAAREGACVANYVEAVAFEKTAGIISGVRAINRVRGSELRIDARQVVNATGPWVDAVCRLAGDDSGPHLRPTKGAHILLPGCGLTAALLLLHPRDRRVFFVMPWPRPGEERAKTLIGTTDTDYDGSPDSLAPSAEDVAYLLEGYNHFAKEPFSASDVLGSFAGLRPLIRDRPGEPSARSREFRIFNSPTGLLSVAGGKYTTFRSMAETITDRIVERLGRRLPCKTRMFPLDGAPLLPWTKFVSAAIASLVTRHDLSESAARHLVYRYGSHADEVAAYLERQPALAAQVVEGEPDLKVEFAYQQDHEMAILPADYLLRRTRLGLVRPQLLDSFAMSIEPTA